MIGAHEPRDRSAVVGAAGGGLEHLTAAARIVDHQEAALVTERAQPVPHGRQFGLHRPLQVGVEHRGHGALVLAELRHDLAGQHHRQVADVILLVFLADDLLGAFLVPGIGEAPQQRDDDRPCSAVHQQAELAPQVVLVQRADDPSGRVDALLDADDHGPRDERCRFALHGEVAALGQAGPVGPLGAAADEDRVLVALGGDQADPGSAPFDQAVHGHGRGVPDDVEARQERLEVLPGLERDLLDRVDEAHRQVVRGGRRLADPALAVEGEHGVGEGAAHVDVGGIERGVGSHPFGCHRAPPSRPGTTSRPSRTSISPAESRCFSRSMSMEMSGVIGCPGGRYSVSTWTPHDGQ